MAQKKKNMNKCWHYYAWFHQMFQNLYLADFLKMNLMEFAVIWVKKGQKAGYLLSISSKTTLAREKEGWEKERVRRKRKKAVVG